MQSNLNERLSWLYSLRTADVFPVVASLPSKNVRKRSDDRKYVCGLQARDYMDWWVISSTWGPPPSCKQVLKLDCIDKSVTMTSKRFHAFVLCHYRYWIVTVSLEEISLLVLLSLYVQVSLLSGYWISCVRNLKGWVVFPLWISELDMV